MGAGKKVTYPKTFEWIDRRWGVAVCSVLFVYFEYETNTTVADARRPY